MKETEKKKKPEHLNIELLGYNYLLVQIIKKIYTRQKHSQLDYQYII